MNIQIKPAKRKKDAKGTKAPKNVFAGEDDSDDETAAKANADTESTISSSTKLEIGTTPTTTTSLLQQQRAAVNRSIAQEQETLYRQHAKTAEEYDFDGTYEESNRKDAPVVSKKDEEKKARYIEDLLKAAERRKRTHDLVYERNIAREQAQEEELDPNLRGKDKFITASYKQKLQEQKQWKAKEEEEEREDEQNDVTKRGTMAHFYGNFTKNVAVGGTRKEEGPSPTTTAPTTAFLDGFSKAEEDPDLLKPNSTEKQQARASETSLDRGTMRNNASSTQETTEQRRLRERRDRETRVASALERYLLRHPSFAG